MSAGNGCDHVVNLTPHEIVVLGLGDQPVRRYPSAGEARAEARRQQCDLVHVADDEYGPIFVPVHRLEFGGVAGLPAAEIGTAYVVSRIAAEAARAEGRPTDDLLIPDDLVRGSDGQPIGCRGFARL